MIRDSLQAGIERIYIKKQRFVGKMKRSRERCIFHRETFRRYVMSMFQPFISCERFFFIPFLPILFPTLQQPWIHQHVLSTSGDFSVILLLFGEISACREQRKGSVAEKERIA